MKKKIEEQENNNSYGIPSDELNFKGSEIVKYKSNSRFTIHGFFSYIMVSIISFIALVIIIDTFKIQLYTIYPDLEKNNVLSL